MRKLVGADTDRLINEGKRKQAMGRQSHAPSHRQSDAPTVSKQQPPWKPATLETLTQTWARLTFIILKMFGQGLMGPDLPYVRKGR